MAWSKWQGALVLSLAASAGLAWSQAPFNRQAATSERTMTVHENGKALRCRVLQTWRTSTGATAYQLQVLETGEQMTIVEEGPGTPVASSGGNNVKAMPMRIFHWGQSKTAPAGAPVPPAFAETAEPGSPSGIRTVANQVVTPASASMSTSSNCAAPCDVGVTGRGPRVIGCADPEERIIAWEEKSGRPYNLQSPPAVVQTSGVRGPVIVEGSQSEYVSGSQRQPLFPRLFPNRSEPTVFSEGVITSSGQQPSPVVVPSGAVVTNPKSPSVVVEKSDDKSNSTMRDKLQNLFHKSDKTKTTETKSVATKQDDARPTQLPATSPTTKKDDKKPFSTATAPAAVLPKANPLTIPSTTETAKKDPKVDPKNNAKAPPLTLPATADATKQEPKVNLKSTPTANAVKPAAAKGDNFDFRKMWGNEASSKVEQPGQSTVEREKPRTDKLKQDILLSPEKFNPTSDKADPKVTTQMANVLPQQPIGLQPAVQPSLPQQPFQQPLTQQTHGLFQPQAPAMQQQVAQAAGPVPTPLGVQSVLSARNGIQGPVQYIPVPVATVPEPIRPPTPPEPKLPEPPNPRQYVNAFSPPPAPAGQDPMQMQAQQLAQYQAMMQYQAWLQQQAMMQRQLAMGNPNMANLIPVGQGAPVQVSYPANYSGPQPPNPFVAKQLASPLVPVGYQQPQANSFLNQAMDRRVSPAAAQQQTANESANLDSLVKVLLESPYPAQREWAATNLSTFDWRLYPHLTQVLVQAAKQDDSATVRAASVYSLSRMNVQSEPVLGTLHALRGDADPRVRQEVEQAYLRMGMRPTQP